MKEFFIYSNSFAAPFFSDSDSAFVKAKDATSALKKFKKNYRHPCGLYAAICYGSADDYHKKKKPLAQWICNHELEKMRLSKGLGSYSFISHGPGDFEIDGKKTKVEDPKEGKILLERP